MAGQRMSAWKFLWRRGREEHIINKRGIDIFIQGIIHGNGSSRGHSLELFWKRRSLWYKTIFVVIVYVTSMIAWGMRMRIKWSVWDLLFTGMRWWHINISMVISWKVWRLKAWIKITVMFDIKRIFPFGRIFPSAAWSVMRIQPWPLEAFLYPLPVLGVMTCRVGKQVSLVGVVYILVRVVKLGLCHVFLGNHVLLSVDLLGVRQDVDSVGNGDPPQRVSSSSWGWWWWRWPPATPFW